MKHLNDLKNENTHKDLQNLALFIEAAGISSDFPKGSDGRVSLPFAIALLCGAQQHHASDDYSDLLSGVPGVYRYRFTNCWDVIEAEVDMDILDWSNSVSQSTIVSTLKSIASSIELS